MCPIYINNIYLATVGMGVTQEECGVDFSDDKLGMGDTLHFSNQGINAILHYAKLRMIHTTVHFES